MNSAFVKLGDIADLTVGYVGNMTKEYKEEGICFFRSLNIKPFYIDKTDLLYISSEFNEKIKKSKLKEGDLVIVRTGQPGTCCVIPKEYDGCNCSDLVIVRPNQEYVNPYYLEAYINFMAQKQINHHQVGAIQKHFNVGSAKEMLVFLPDRDKQERVANLVRNINSKIENNNKINAELESMAKTIYDYWFLQFEFPNKEGNAYKSSGGKMVWNEKLKREIPEEWKVAKLDDIAEMVTKSINPKKDQKYQYYSIPSFDETGIPIIELGENIDSNKYCVPNDSILVSKLNPQFKRLWYVGNTTEDSICSTEFIPFTSRNNAKEFLYSVLNNDSFYKFMVQSSSSSTGSRKRIQPELMKSFILCYPSDEKIIYKYCKAVKDMLEKIIEGKKENQELASLRDFLLPLLMNGQVGFKD